VISTGSTLEGMRVILQKANVGEIVAEAAILTEGDFEKWRNILALGHLPVWVDD
jgi:adenine phosphoribosyltransferase